VDSEAAFGEQQLGHVVRDLVPLAALRGADMGEDLDEHRRRAWREGVDLQPSQARVGAGEGDQRGAADDA
jgi:hypothetical protein